MLLELARQYVAWGRFDLAGSLLSEALTLLDKADHSVSTEARVAFYLDFAAATAEGGSIEEGLAAYAEAMSLAEMLSVEPVPSGASKPLHRIRAIIQSATAANTFSAIQEFRVCHDFIFKLLNKILMS